MLHVLVQVRDPSDWKTHKTHLEAQQLKVNNIDWPSRVRTLYVTSIAQVQFLQAQEWIDSIACDESWFIPVTCEDDPSSRTMTDDAPTKSQEE